ncbi:MAG: nicotinate-nucleotide diphosphorylase (carboxylating) [Thermoanaerobaculum sp.]|nr:MAG: nicotinate-nucleotide diphosphorylase (carboxylating) [Thermoanaerobaculum sp.]
MSELPEPYATNLPPLLALAFSEDLPDITGNAIFTAEAHAQARIIAKKDGVLAGVPAAGFAFRFLDPRCQVEFHLRDGSAVTAGQTVLEVWGPARALLAAERTALNFLMRLSGVATFTRKFVSQLDGTGCRLLDTRKTTPGFRRLEKHAVRCGGGTNHRMGLFDAAMIKDTHIAACGSITQAVARVRKVWGEKVPLIVECASLEQVDEALACHVPHLLLDNMDLPTLRQAVAKAKGKAVLEASGGVQLENVREVALTGVDFVSVGAITHSAPALDCSMEVVG